MTLAATIKPRTCKNCGNEFHPWSTTQNVCGKLCALRLVRAAKKEEAERTKARKIALKRIPDLIAEAQKEFNAFIRRRDIHMPCVCCGNPLTLDAVGGGFDCGHYRSTGSASHLRFNEDNAHAQRKVCNRYGAGRAVDYRIGLIARIGLERVEALESNCAPHKWTHEELIEIKEKYKQKLRELVND